MSWKEGTKRLTIHFYPGTKRPDLGMKRPDYETTCTHVNIIKLFDVCYQRYLLFLSITPLVIVKR